VAGTEAGATEANHPAQDSPTTAAHPEEMRVTMNLSLGKWVSVNAAARATPAGFVAIACLMSAILIPIMWAKKKPG
jgi:hypothetical protein